MVPGASPFRPRPRFPAVGSSSTDGLTAALATLGGELRANAWELALAVIEEALADDTIPSLTRLGRISQFGDMPTFITELSREVEAPLPGRMRVGGPLAAVARDHARQREALGFAPREVVTEFLLLRRVLWRFVASRIDGLGGTDVLELERRLNDTIDRLVTECVVAYFDRATAELAEQARRDPLTGLLNHQAFSDVLEVELERAARYDHGLTLVFLDLDGFKRINDTSVTWRATASCTGSASLALTIAARLRHGGAHRRRRVRRPAPRSGQARRRPLPPPLPPRDQRADSSRAAPGRLRPERRLRALSLGGSRCRSPTATRRRASVRREAHEGVTAGDSVPPGDG